MSPGAAPARWTALHSSRVEMSLPSAQLVVAVVPRAGDEAMALPSRFSEITGRSRTQLAIELQRGEVEVLRSGDRGEISRMVEQLAAMGLLAVVREASVPDAGSAAPVAGEGWGRVLGSFDTKVAVSPSRLPERLASSRAAATESWQPADPVPLRLGEMETMSSEPHEAVVDGRARRVQAARLATGRDAERDLMDEASGLNLAPAAGSRLAAKKPRTGPTLPSARVVVVALTMLLAAGVAYMIYQRMHRALAEGVVSPPGPAPTLAPAALPSPPATASSSPQEQVQLLVDRAREACRSAEFERCKELADQALNLDETNRAAQAVHIKAVTAISAQAGRPSPNPTPAVGPQ